MRRTAEFVLCICVFAFVAMPVTAVHLTVDSSQEGMLVVHLSGTPREMGLQYGHALRGEIRENLNGFWEAAEAQGMQKSDLLAVTSERSLPQDMIDELKAMSEASGVRYAELLAFNEFGPSIIKGACTCFVARGDATLDGTPVSFKTMDWCGWNPVVVLVMVKPEQGNGYMGLTFAGSVGISSQGMNDKGLAVGYNYLPVPEEYADGLGPWEIQELVLRECDSVGDVITLAGAIPKREGVNLMVSDAYESAFVETASSIYSPNVAYRIITSGFDVHTNHWLYEPFSSWVLDGWGVDIWTASLSRYDRAMELGAEHEGELTEALLMSFTRDLEGWDCSPKDVIALYPEYADLLEWAWPGDSICNTQTKNACVFEVDETNPTLLSTMWMTACNPCYSPFVPIHNAVLYDAETVTYASEQLEMYLSGEAYRLRTLLNYGWGELVPVYEEWEAGIIEDLSAVEAQALALIEEGDLEQAAHFLVECDCDIALDAVDLQMSLD